MSRDKAHYRRLCAKADEQRQAADAYKKKVEDEQAAAEYRAKSARQYEDAIYRGYQTEAARLREQMMYVVSHGQDNGTRV